MKQQLNLFNFINNNIKGTTIKTLKYIDLFCGAGGFSLGFDRSGFHNIFSVDIEENFCKTYKTNFPTHTLIQKDISQITENEIKGFKEKIFYFLSLNQNIKRDNCGPSIENSIVSRSKIGNIRHH